MVKESYPRLKILNTYETSVLTYMKIIRQVDCVVYGGGTLYKELYASTGRSPYSVIRRLMGFNVIAKLLGTNVYHLNIGIGSLKTDKGKAITRRALMAASHTMFRDEASYELALKELRVPEKKISKSTDGLFLDRIWQRQWHTGEAAIDRSKYKRVVGVNLLSDIPDWVDREQYVARAREFVTYLLDRGDYVLFVPFQTDFNPRNDLMFMRETFGDILNGRDNYVMPSRMPIDQIHWYLQQCDVFVGARFHSLLLSAAAGTPFVAVAYDTKCWRFVTEAGYPYGIQLEELESERLVELCESAFRQRDKIRVWLSQLAERLYGEAEEDIRKISF